MATSLVSTGVQFPDSSVQLRAAIPGGSESYSNTNPLTLTSTSKQVQIVRISSTANSYVTLPDATTMPSEGTNVFLIVNLSPVNTSLEVRSNDGAPISPAISPGGSRIYHLASKGTAAGKWIAGPNVNIPTFHSVNSTSITSVNTTVSSTYRNPYAQIVPLSATAFILAYVTWPTSTTTTITYTLRQRVCTISGSTITVGAEHTSFNLSPQNGTDASYSPVSRGIRLTDNSWIWYLGTAAYNNGGNIMGAASQIIAFTRSGTTISAGSATSLSFPNFSNLQANGYQNESIQRAYAVMYNALIVRMSDTKFAVIYNTGATHGSGIYFPANYTGSLTCNICTVSGTTITVGTKVDLGSSLYSQVLSVVCHDTDRLCVTYAQPSAQYQLFGDHKVVIVSVSGTTPTWGTPVTRQTSDYIFRYFDGSYISPTNGGGDIGGAKLSTTRTIMGLSSNLAIIVSISNTTPTIAFADPNIIGCDSYMNLIDSVGDTHVVSAVSGLSTVSYLQITNNGILKVGPSTIIPTIIPSNAPASFCIIPAANTKVFFASAGSELSANVAIGSYISPF